MSTVYILAVFALQVKPVFTKNANVATDVSSTPSDLASVRLYIVVKLGFDYLASTFHTLPDYLQQQTLLGIQPTCFGSANIKEAGIKVCWVILQKIPVFCLDSMGHCFVIKAIHIIAGFWDTTQSIFLVQKKFPEFSIRLDSAWKSHCHPHNRNRFELFVAESLF